MTEDVDELCLEAREDYVGLWELVHCVEERQQTAEAVKAEALEMVRTLVARGLLAGNVTNTGRFEAWGGRQVDAVVRRIEEEWQALGRRPSVNEIVSFDLPE